MLTATKVSPNKNALDIRLAESVVFVRAGDATGRQRTIQADAPPGMVRGLLVLTLAKPTRITSIEVELLGRTVTAWPEGVGARRIEVAEEHDIYSQSYVFFRAGHAPGTVTRRTLSVGPGLSLEHEEEDHSEESSVQHEGRSDEERDRPRPTLGSGRSRPHRRHMSVDQTHFQRSFVDHRENARSPGTPPMYSPVFYPDELPHPSPPIQRSPLTIHEESPVGSLEDVRRALEAEQDFSGFARSPSRVGRSSSGIWTPREVPGSRRVSLDEDREFQVGSSVAQLPQHGIARTPSRLRELEADDALRGRKNKRAFSFASALFEAMRDRVRSSSPRVERERGQSGYITPPRGRTMDRTLLQPGGYTKDTTQIVHNEVTTPLGRVGEEGREHGDGWKEFRKGVYTYPISFAIPASAPPSLTVDFGSVSWKLKAVVHRPGTFKTKFTASRDITVVVTPSEDDTEESESIIVERQWDTQMQYLILISGRSFTVGGVLPITITFMPWTKMKIHRISVLIEERVDYWTGFRRIARTDPVNRVCLLTLKYPKNGPYLLPLISDDPDALKQSPLSEVINPEDDYGEVVSSFMGPGPWTIRKDLQLPKGDGLHITNKNRRSNIAISHMLKIIFRVERGDDSAMDAHTGKRKLFDIVVQTPVHILSHLCNPEHTSLPPYTSIPGTLSSSSHPVLAMHPVDGVRVPRRHVGEPISNAGTAPHSRAGSLAPPTSSASSLLARGPSPSPGVGARAGAGAYTRAPADSADTLASGDQSPSSARGSRRRSIQERTTELFERLIAGQESEEGEAPPPYEVAVETASVATSPGAT